jgi:aspartate aminotransferase
MPAISYRGAAMPASPIRRLMPYADQAKAQGVRVFHLNIGQPDVDSPEEFWSAVRRPDLRVLEYSNSAGNASLRRKMADAYRAMGIDVEPSQLIVTTAGSEALRFAMVACLNPGDEVIVPEPLYANYLGFATEAMVSVLPITTRIEDDFRLPEPKAFEERISPRTRALLVCNPGNPTGAVYTQRQLEELRDIALRHDLFVIADEVYREFNYTNEPIASVLQLEGLERHAVMTDSVSKRFSLCGARVGFLVSRNADVMDAATRMAQARLSPPALEQIGVEAALDAPPAYFAAMREEYRLRRDLLMERLRAMPGVRVPRIDGAFYAMVRLPIDDGDRFCQWMLEKFRYDNATVMMAPGAGFYETPGLGRDEVRIAYVLGRDDLSRALDCLEQALVAYPGRAVTA